MPLESFVHQEVVVQHQKPVAGDMQLAHLTDPIEAVLFESLVVVGQRIAVQRNIERLVRVLPEDLEENAQSAFAALRVGVGQLPFLVVRGSLAFVALFEVERSYELASNQLQQGTLVGWHSYGAKICAYDIAQVHAQMARMAIGRMPTGSPPQHALRIPIWVRLTVRQFGDRIVLQLHLDVAQIIADIHVDFVGWKYKNNSLVQADRHIVSQSNTVLLDQLQEVFSQRPGRYEIDVEH